MAIDDIEAASSQFFNLVADEPFIRTLLDDDGGTTPPAGRTEAAVALLLQAYGHGPRAAGGAWKPASQAMPPRAGVSTCLRRGGSRDTPRVKRGVRRDGGREALG